VVVDVVCRIVSTLRVLQVHLYKAGLRFVAHSVLCGDYDAPVMDECRSAGMLQS
jgi:hypothetical protein